MPTLVYIHGNPLSSGTLKQQQSETTEGSYLRRQWAAHPSLGIDIHRLYRIFRRLNRAT